MGDKIAEMKWVDKIIGLDGSPMLRSYLIPDNGGRDGREVCRGKDSFADLFPELIPLFSECVVEMGFGCSGHGYEGETFCTREGKHR
jgi:hypothetical protein